MFPKFLTHSRTDHAQTSNPFTFLCILHCDTFQIFLFNLPRAITQKNPVLLCTFQSAEMLPSVTLEGFAILWTFGIIQSVARSVNPLLSVFFTSTTSIIILSFVECVDWSCMYLVEHLRYGKRIVSGLLQVSIFTMLSLSFKSASGFHFFLQCGQRYCGSIS